MKQIVKHPELVQIARKSFYGAFARFPENSLEDLKSYKEAREKMLADVEAIANKK